MKHNKKFHLGATIIMFIMMLVKSYLVIYTNSAEFQVIGTITLMVYSFLAILMLFKNSFIEKLIWWGIYYFGLIIMELITVLMISLLTHKSVQELSMDEFSLWIIVLSKLITLLLFEFIIRKRTGNLVIEFSYFKELSLVIIVNIILLLGVVYAFSNIKNIENNINNIILFFFGIVLIISIFMIVLIFKIEKKSKEELATKLKLQQIELELKLNEDMINITDKLRKLRHDMNNHIGIIKTLVHTQKYDDLQEYITQIYEDVEVANDLVITENKTISVLLNAKKNKAKEKNIDFQSMIAMKEINMQNKDICALLGNILDNAIEAAEQVTSNKFIQLTMQKTQQGCVISCENSLCVKPVIKKGKFITSKSDTLLHGIGTENIKDIVAKYKGEVHFNFDDETFNIKVEIPA
jgi:hypothetical protein